MKIEMKRGGIEFPGELVNGLNTPKDLGFLERIRWL